MPKRICTQLESVAATAAMAILGCASGASVPTQAAPPPAHVEQRTPGPSADSVSLDPADDLALRRAIAQQAELEEHRTRDAPRQAYARKVRKRLDGIAQRLVRAEALASASDADEPPQEDPGWLASLRNAKRVHLELSGECALMRFVADPDWHAATANLNRRIARLRAQADALIEGAAAASAPTVSESVPRVEES